MLDKLEEIKRRYEDVEAKLSDPKVIADMRLFKKLNIEYKELGEIVTHINEYKKVLGNIDGAKDVLATEKDKDFLEMAKAELEENKEREIALTEEIRMLLIPKDPEDVKNCVMELLAEPAATRLLYSRVIFLKCTAGFVRKKDTSWR